MNEVEQNVEIKEKDQTYYKRSDSNDSGSKQIKENEDNSFREIKNQEFDGIFGTNVDSSYVPTMQEMTEKEIRKTIKKMKNNENFLLKVIIILILFSLFSLLLILLCSKLQK